MLSFLPYSSSSRLSRYSPTMAQRPIPMDIKEHICRIIHEYDVCHSQISAASKRSSTGVHRGRFDNINVTLSHVNSEWRRVALRYAWRTIRVTSHRIEASLPEIRTTHGHHTRKLYILVQFKGTADASTRRYSFTQETQSMHPFSDLLLWPHLQELEIDYAHKCAFPGLAQYIEPRLGNIRILVIGGRIPIDMRRGALFMKAANLREIHIRAMITNKDSLSTIGNLPDSILTRPVMQTLTHLSITPMVDVRIARWVLSTQRESLRWLDVSGFNSEQLSAIRLFCVQDSGLVAAAQHSRMEWRCLESLTVRIANLVPIHIQAPVSFSLNAEEFPQLKRLRMRICSCTTSVWRAPLNISYYQTFAAKWEKLTSLEIPALDDNDAMLIAQNMPRLSQLYAPADPNTMELTKSFSMSGLWHLLASALPLESIRIGFISSEDAVTNCVVHHPIIDFSCIRPFHPLQILHIPQVWLSADHMSEIRHRCLHLHEGITRDPGVSSLGYKILWSLFNV